MESIYKVKNVLINITVLVLAISLTSEIWIGFSATYPSLILFVGAISFLSLAGLFFINLGFAMFQSKQKIAHITMSLLIIIMIFWFAPLSTKWHRNTEHRWFFQNGMQAYEVMVDKVVQNKARLTFTSSSLEAIVGRPHVYGRTDTNGSIIVEFSGRGGYSRAGYLYYSGSQMAVNPENTNQYCLPDNPYRFYFHLTNGWYEF